MDIYNGNEIRYLTWEEEECVNNDDGTVYICTGNCDITSIGFDNNFSIFVGDTFTNGSNIYKPVTFEGNFLSTGYFNTNSNVSIIGSLYVGTVLTQSLFSTITVKDCVLLKDTTLEIVVTDSDLQYIESHPDKVYNLIDSSCFNQNFSKIVVTTQSGCKQVEVGSTVYDSNGLSASFVVSDDKCTQITIIIVTVCVVGAIVVIGIILVAVPKTRRAIFPYRARTRERYREREGEISSKSSVKSSKSGKEESESNEMKGDL